MQQSLQQALVDFHKEFARVTVPDDAVIFSCPAADVIKLGFEKRIPLVKLCPPQVSSDEFFNVFEQVCEIVIEFTPELAEDIDKIAATLPVEPEERMLFVSRAFTPGTSLITDVTPDYSTETFGFLINHTVKPFMLRYSQEVGKLYELEMWLKGDCPVCGGKPSLALLEKGTGKRQLYCGLCEIKWRFHRLGCPYCLDGESHFFTVEGMEKYRVYYCRKCHGYIKTLDQEKTDGKSVNLFWEDINTVHLDILAMREGYFNEQACQPLKDPEK